VILPFDGLVNELSRQQAALAGVVACRERILFPS